MIQNNSYNIESVSFFFNQFFSLLFYRYKCFMNIDCYCFKFIWIKKQNTKKIIVISYSLVFLLPKRKILIIKEKCQSISINILHGEL